MISKENLQSIVGTLTEYANEHHDEAAHCKDLIAVVRNEIGLREESESIEHRAAVSAKTGCY